MEPTYKGLKPQDVHSPLAGLLGRLEPTYKGLKQGDLDVHRGVQRGLEPTYKGLKQPEVFGVGQMGSSGLEPTYKGLKLTSYCRTGRGTSTFGAYL